jgi:ABC-type multidrug transport system ATPase subunit
MIEIDHVSKRFGRVCALDDVCLKIQAGERIALVGTNGSGKTTLLRALLGLIRVEGHVRIGTLDVAEAPEYALRELAYVPQISPPLDAPVRDVLATFAALRGIHPQACLDSAASLGLGLTGALGTRFRDLSGGMRQKLLAAMALAANPRILVCDEPTANLDSAARRAFLEQLERRATDSILIVCSHHEADVRPLVTRIVEMRDGSVLSDRPLVGRSTTRLRVVP